MVADSAASPASNTSGTAGGRLSRRTRILLYVLAGAVAIVLVLSVIDAIAFGRGRSYAARRAREERAWWTSLWHDVPAAGNRYCAYQALAASLPDSFPALCRNTSALLSRGPEFGDTWPADDEPIRRDIHENEAALEDLLAAAGRPHYMIPNETLGNVGEGLLMRGSLLRVYGRLRWLGKLLTWQAWLDIREGGRAEGIRRLRAVVRLGSDMATGSTSYGYLLGATLHQDVAMVIADTHGLPGWRPSQLQGLARDFRTMALPPLYQCVRVELLTALAHVAARASFFDASQAQEPLSLPARMLWSRFEALSVEEYDRRMQAIISALQQRDGTARALVDGINDGLIGMDRGRAANWMSATMIPNIRASEPATATLTLTAIALRVRAAYLTTGRFPESLPDIAQIDGIDVPRGPFGEPFRMIRTEGHGVVVYDTGNDREDNRGHNVDTTMRREFPPVLRERSSENDRQTQRDVRRSLARGDDLAIEISVDREE